jgi:hypothetical protein
MSRLSELAAYIADDKRQAEDLGTYLLASRELAHDLRRAFAQFGAERTTGRLVAVADLIGAAQNTRWLTVGHLEDALLIIKGAMTGDYAAAGGSLTPRRNPDGSLNLLGRYRSTDVSLRVTAGYRPRVARLRERLGMPTAPPEELDTTGDGGLPKLNQLSRKLTRAGADVHAQFKDTASTSIAAGRFERHGADTPQVTGEGVAALAIISVLALDVIARATRDSLWRAR